MKRYEEGRRGKKRMEVLGRFGLYKWGRAVGMSHIRHQCK